MRLDELDLFKFFRRKPKEDYSDQHEKENKAEADRMDAIRLKAKLAQSRNEKIAAEDRDTVKRQTKARNARIGKEDKEFARQHMARTGGKVDFPVIESMLNMFKKTQPIEDNIEHFEEYVAHLQTTEAGQNTILRLLAKAKNDPSDEDSQKRFRILTKALAGIHSAK